ncbi:hypothetical protein, partial [Parafrankia sp. EUN1f]|uniref:hypothetical protein n=1 Tax=Parafrankia sp. EUN1f TaxID=102897 RepID=UPI00056D994A
CGTDGGGRGGGRRRTGASAPTGAQPPAGAQAVVPLLVAALTEPFPLAADNAIENAVGGFG